MEALRPIAQAHGKSVAACAIRFILDHLSDSVVIAGVKSAAQLRSNLEAMDWRLAPEELAALERLSRD